MRVGVHILESAVHGLSSSYHDDDESNNRRVYVWYGTIGTHSTYNCVLDTQAEYEILYTHKNMLEVVCLQPPFPPNKGG